MSESSPSFPPPVFPPPGFPPPLAKFLTNLHEQVRQNLRQFAADRSRVSGGNAKGDIQRVFDISTDQLIRDALRDFFPSGMILTEEGDDLTFGTPPPLWKFVVDPVDGSDNWRLGLAYSAVCISAFPPAGSLDPSTQIWALVGDLQDGIPPLLAARGAGAWKAGVRRQTSGATRLSSATISVQLSHAPRLPALLDLFSTAKSVRCYGSSAHDLALVAEGKLDAHVDLRRRLTPESFLAAGLALEEAGGCIVTPRGEPLPPFQTLTDKVSLVAAATRELAAEIVRVVQSAET